MADNMLDGLLNTSTNSLDSIRQQYYEKYKDRFKDSTEDLINSETFLSLMVAEMTNQDPLEPTSNTEFVTQLASFSQLSYARDSSKYAMANYASSLVGKIVTATKPNGKDAITKTGVVESVSKKGDTYNVFIDGEAFDITKVTKVQPNDSTSGGSVTGSTNALADSIARASGMIGMYVTVPTEDNGETGIASGWIDTIKVKDGKITAVLADENGNRIGEYDLASLTEITYATIGSGNDGSTDADKAPGTDKTEEEKPDTTIPDNANTTGDKNEENKTPEVDKPVTETNKGETDFELPNDDDDIPAGLIK